MVKQPIFLKSDAERARIEPYGTDVANGIAANATDFPDPLPRPSDVLAAIEAYVASIKPERDRSIATDEATNHLRNIAIKQVNSLISFAFFKVQGDVEKLRNANIEFPKTPTKREMKKLEVKSSRMGQEKGTYFFRLSGKAGANIICVFRKEADGSLRMVDAFDGSYFTLVGQPSGSQTYVLRGKKRDKWGPESNEITVWIP